MRVKRHTLVFVVDDDPAVIEVLNTFLTDACFHVRQFRNGQEVLDFSHVQEPDVVISDVQMPCLDGVSMARQIRQRYPHCQVLLMSGNPPVGTGFKVFQKPVSLASLLRALD